MDCEKAYEKVCLHYAENPKTMTSEKLFETINSIWNNYKKVNLYLINLKRLKLRALD